MAIPVPLRRRSDSNSTAKQPELTAEFLQQAHKLVHRLFSPAGQSGPAAVMFCGIDRGSGCSTVCCQVAEILTARAPGAVCVVDASLRAPSLHRKYHLENRTGFSDALVNHQSLQGFAQQVQGTKLWVVTAGTALDVSLTAYQERLQSQLLTLRTVFDYVLIDAGPVNLSADAIQLGKSVEGAVLVIESNSAKRESARQAKEALRRANIRIFGAVLNKWTSPDPVKETVAKASAQPVEREPLREPKRVPPEQKATPQAEPAPAPPIERKTPPVQALVRVSTLDIPGKRAKRRLWKRLVRPATAPGVESAPSVAKESRRETTARRVPKNVVSGSGLKQGVWNKPATSSAKETQKKTRSEEAKAATPEASVADSTANNPSTPSIADDAVQDQSPLSNQQNRPPSSAPFWQSKGFAAAAGTFAVGATLWFTQARSPLHLRQEAREAVPVVISNPLGLQVDRAGAMLDIVWDRTSALAANSNGGSVTIRDGDLVKRVPLNPGEIRTGHIYYGPRSADLDIRLEVAVEDGGTATESVRVVGAMSDQSHS
jgi:Mrp family chromosome partitioning ATPase